MDPADIGDASSSESDDPRSKATKSTRRAAGRRTRISSERIAAVCAGIRNGMPVEHAAATAGVPPSTFHSWMKVARDLEETKPDASALTPRERLCGELLSAVRRAEADSLEKLQAVAVKAATAHRVSKIVVSRTQRLDKNGDPKWCESIRQEITEGPHIGAVLELLKRRALEFSQWAQKQEAEQISLEDREITERLVRNLHAYKRTLAEDAGRADAAAATWRGPATTEDDSDYEYAAWMWTLQGVSSDAYDDYEVPDDLNRP